MSILETIVNYKRREVEAAKQVVPQEALVRQVVGMLNDKPTRRFAQAIKASPTGIISEFKRRSPSKGEIHAMADVEQVIKAYTANGATCCSVLTDSRFFGGSLTDFNVARNSTTLPLIRKDFVIDEYQILEARAHQADAILLIAAVLTKQEIMNFIRFADALNMQTLLEIHDERELDRFDDATHMVGINNRNLHNFVTDIEASCRLIEQLPKKTVKISESGISSPSQLAQLRDAGFDGFLIGERFMKHEHPGDALKHFIDAI
jgi:indole-3-glycerol phosphate synthase